MSWLRLRSVSLTFSKINVASLKDLLVIATLLTTMSLETLGISFLDFIVLADLVLFALLLKLGRMW
jgi:hypothetical protein